MFNVADLYFLSGLTVQYLMLFFHQSLQIRKYRILSLLTIIFFIACYIFIKSNVFTHLRNQGKTGPLLAPGIFLVVYFLLRKLFLLIFKNEPIVAMFYSLSWEQGEYRKLHFGDLIFTALNMILPIGISLFFF